MLESEQLGTDQEEFCYVICMICTYIKNSKYCSKVKSKKNILLLFDKLCILTSDFPTSLVRMSVSNDKFM
jgi:hypothetical protein